MAARRVASDPTARGRRAVDRWFNHLDHVQGRMLIVTQAAKCKVRRVVGLLARQERVDLLALNPLHKTQASHPGEFIGQIA